MKRLVTLLAAVALAFSVGAPVAATAATAARDGGLSELGQAAVADLRTCLASNDVLNVYYLIDNSTSLRRADAGGPGSDPDNLRAPILGNSLAQLAELADGRSVNWAAGFFSDGFDPAVSWRPVGAGSSSELEAEIAERRPSGYTNWPAALRGAQRELDRQQQAQPGCQLLVWLTDGQIDISSPDGMQSEDRTALNEMCGAVIDPNGAAPSGNGIFNSFRQSGVVVIGALLATTAGAVDAGQVMRPLIEGQDAAGAVRCGEQPMPAGHVHGAFVEADSPGALQQVFLQLGAQVGGGFPHPFDADGSFWIDPGVARFRIVASGTWTLHPPAESGLEAATSAGGADWLEANVDPGVIDVATDDPAMHGRWRLDDADTRALFLFSDLTIAFEPTNKIELGAEGMTGTLVAHVRDADGADTDLESFAPGTFSARLVDADGSRTALAGAEVDTATGEITIPIPAGVTTAEVVVEASIDPLTTTAHALELAPITTQQRIKTVLPTDYPRVAEVPVRLSALEGRDGEARGVLIVSGPEAAADGFVCIRQDPVVVSDSSQREDSWRWTVGGERDADGCVVVPAGETVEIPLTAANSEAADSSVRAALPVSLRSANGPELTQDTPIVFTSTHPLNVAAVGIIALVLLALGLLLPLVLVWLINWLTTRLEIDSSIQRAALPAVVTASGVSFPDAPASDTALSERFRYRGAAHNVRSIDDPDIGRIRTAVHWFPFVAPTYRVVPGGDRVVVAARTGARTGSMGDRHPDGSVRFANLPLDAFWAIVVNRAEVSRTAHGEDVRATAVIYHRGTSSGPAQYRERLADISRETRLADVIDGLRAEFDAASAAAPTSSRDAAPARRPADAETSATGTTPPPRPGAGATSSAPPPRPGSPPPRPGAQPPPTSGGPPPRPGR